MFDLVREKNVHINNIEYKLNNLFF